MSRPLRNLTPQPPNPPPSKSPATPAASTPPPPKDEGLTLQIRCKYDQTQRGFKMLAADLQMNYEDALNRIVKFFNDYRWVETSKAPIRSYGAGGPDENVPPSDQGTQTPT